MVFGIVSGDARPYSFDCEIPDGGGGGFIETALPRQPRGGLIEAALPFVEIGAIRVGRHRHAAVQNILEFPLAYARALWYNVPVKFS